MLARRIRNSLAVMGALLPFAAFAEDQPRKTVAVGNTEGRQRCIGHGRCLRQGAGYGASFWTRRGGRNFGRVGT